MAKQTLAREQVLAMLQAGPPQIAEATANLLPPQLHDAPAPGEWSLNDVLAHLRACADMWGKCIVAMLAEDTPTLRAINPRKWIASTDYPLQEFRASLRAFTVQRADLLAVLEPLSPEDWSRSAIVWGAGKTLERTVYFYANWLALHERPHLKQIARVAAEMRAK